MLKIYISTFKDLRKMMSYLILISALSTPVFAAQIKQTTITSNVLLNAYVKKVGGELIEDTTRITNLVNIGADTEIIEESTWLIPNKLGTGFEIAVGFQDIPLDITHFDLFITFPETALPSGETRSQLSRQIDITGHKGFFLWNFTFFFDFPYEASQGIWDLKIHSQGNLIHSSRFTVIDHTSLQ